MSSGSASRSARNWNRRCSASGKKGDTSTSERSSRSWRAGVLRRSSLRSSSPSAASSASRRLARSARFSVRCSASAASAGERDDVPDVLHERGDELLVGGRGAAPERGPQRPPVGPDPSVHARDGAGRRCGVHEVGGQLELGIAPLDQRVDVLGVGVEPRHHAPVAARRPEPLLDRPDGVGALGHPRVGWRGTGRGCRRPRGGRRDRAVGRTAASPPGHERGDDHADEDRRDRGTHGKVRREAGHAPEDPHHEYGHHGEATTVDHAEAPGRPRPCGATGSEGTATGTRSSASRASANASSAARTRAAAARIEVGWRTTVLGTVATQRVDHLLADAPLGSRTDLLQGLQLPRQRGDALDGRDVDRPTPRHALELAFRARNVSSSASGRPHASISIWSRRSRCERSSGSRSRWLTAASASTGVSTRRAPMRSAMTRPASSGSSWTTTWTPGPGIPDVVGEEIGHPVVSMRVVYSGTVRQALRSRARSAPVAVLPHRRSCRGASRCDRRVRSGTGTARR